MEKQNICKLGVIKLPPGFRFHPTDEELVVHYLKRKVFACPLPSSIISEIDICKYDPWDLPGDLERERYFFSRRETKYPNGNRPNRAAGSGCWKATGKDKQILNNRTNQVVGMKKILVFYRGKPTNGSKTDWVMHEYRLADAGSKPCIFPHRKSSTQNCIMTIEDWVLCRIFLKKKSAKMDLETIQPCNDLRVGNFGFSRTGFIDLILQQQTQMEQSSDSSSITEVSSTAESSNGENDSSGSTCSS